MSAVPDALDALVAMGRRALPRVQVVDGPPTVDIVGDVIAVGITPNDPADVEAVEDIRGLAVVGESFTVACVARSWSGNDSVKAQRDRTYALLAPVKAALQADPTLGGVVLRARFAGSSYMPWRSEQNQLVVDVVFRVAVNVLV